MKKLNQPQNETPAGKKTKRIAAFKIISILIPFLILFLLEITLSVFHYGYDFSLFIEYPEDKNFLYLNPDASKKYFSNQKNATTGNVEPFKKQKDNNTVRIFVLGESTTIGYPYFHNGSFHRWLQYRLTHTYPDQNFEIVNIALTAVNSYTVMGFAKEVVDYEPDAILIYTGHNEYYGALGVGSTENIGGNRILVKLMLHLRELKIIQLLSSLYEKISAINQGNNENSEGTRMQRMVADQQIPYQSKSYQRGVDQFRSNMDETLELLNKHHIPVFVSNLVSNEKDLKPFVSFPVDSIQFPKFQANYNLGMKAINDENEKAAYTYLKTANQIYGENAYCNFYLGKLEFDLGNYGEAKQYFSKGRDLDGLRFRAPGEFNSILTQLANKYSNTHLVDTKAVFEANSVHHVIGQELILEHVHPDLTGYALMSDAFYKAIKRENLITSMANREMTFSQLLKEMPVNQVDSLSGVYKVANLKNSWPFTGTMQTNSFQIKSFEEKLAHNLANRKVRWTDAMNQLYDHYIANHDLQKARTTVETLILENPLNAQFYMKSAMLSGELKDEENALFNFKKAFHLSPSFDIARYIFVICLKLDKPGNALPYLDYAIQNNTSGFDLKPVKIYAQQIIELQKVYTKDTANVLILNHIADVYLKMDNRDGALKYAGKVLKVDNENREALILMGKLKVTGQ